MSLADQIGEFVTNRSRLVLAVSVVLLLAITAGVTGLTAASGDAISSEPPAQDALRYVQDNYRSGSENLTIVTVYVRGEGDTLDKSSLRNSLRYQHRVQTNDTVDAAFGEGRAVSVSKALTTQLTGDPDATLAERMEALNATSPAQLRDALTQLLVSDSPLLRLMPNSYEPGTATASGRRIAFVVPDSALAEEEEGDGPTDEALERVVYEELPTDTNPEYFTLAGPAGDGLLQRANQDMIELIAPITLVLILLSLLVAYRDVVDIVVGLIGVTASVLATVGLMGWLEIPFGSTGTIIPILIVGLSIDYSFHVFMRYRERRDGSGNRRRAMREALSKVSVALALVTLTTALGFLSNVVSPVPELRNLTISMALGIVAAFVVFTTFVPALKIEADELRARFGWDPMPDPFGDGGRVGSFLTLGVRAARVSAVLVIVVAVVGGAGGLFAWTQVDQSLQSGIGQPDEWSQELPEPFKVGEYDWLENRAYVESSYLATAGESSPSQVLVRGNVTNTETLHRLSTARENTIGTDAAYTRAGGSTEATGPLTEMQRLAETNPQFQAVYRAADTDDDSIPERNVTGVYDAFYRHAPARAANAIEREDGRYRSLRLIVQTKQDMDAVKVDDALTDAVAPLRTVEGVDTEVTGQKAVTAGIIRIAVQSVFETVLISLGGVLALLLLVYRLTEGSALLGAVVFFPVALVVAAISLGMLVLDVTVTFITALMIGLVIGLGVDYSVHISDRFVSELDGVTDPFEALDRTLTGTGGALFGSTITTVAAFGTLALSPFEQTADVGAVVGLALVGAFVASVFVLPSLLVLWHRHVGRPTPEN
jgi:predicted RND superfamily exporter protein